MRNEFPSALVQTTRLRHGSGVAVMATLGYFYFVENTAVLGSSYWYLTALFQTIHGLVGSIFVTSMAPLLTTPHPTTAQAENVTAVTDGITRLQQLKPVASTSSRILEPRRLTASLLTRCNGALFLKPSLARRMQWMRTAILSTKASTSPSWCRC